ncbi:hypothetical protein PanWU01x14_094590 [Parasponia andersonii]|uniref:Gnk2-like domain containing protein n=1 Tax=Parasponia andersonii TaxID=3476 RepID=A0A2P5D5J5_PARAD|nr:hypothetical protein PanWU01x14_094590 [Parasponia andersonii]
MWNPGNVSSSTDTVARYFRVLRSLLDNLKSRTVACGSLQNFATGNVSAPSFRPIYGLEERGTNLGTSCNFRFEDYLFYDVPTASSPPTSATSPKRTVIIAVVPSVVVVVLIVSTCACLRVREAKKKVRRKLK